MKRIVWLVVILIMLSFALPVSAQQVVTLKTVQVEFWPEFDQPSMLVIYKVELPEDTPLPVNVTLKVPANAGPPNAVAVAIDDQLMTAEYTREVDGEWANINVVAESNTVQVEYYDPGLSRDGVDREYVYSWFGNYAVNDFIVRVQTPVGATNMTFSDEMQGPQVANDGLGYYNRSFGSLEFGEKLDFSISYTKSDNTLSFDAITNLDNPITPGTAESGGIFSDAPPWLWVIVGLGVVLIGFGGWSLLSDSNKKPKKSQSSYKKKRSRSGTPANASKKSAKFCHNCGSPAQAGDKFCRECGEKLRV